MPREETLTPPPSAYDRLDATYNSFKPERRKPYIHMLGDGTTIQFIRGRNRQNPSMRIHITHPLAEESFQFVVDSHGLSEITVGPYELSFHAVGKTEQAGSLTMHPRMTRKMARDPELFAAKGDFLADKVGAMIRKDGYIPIDIGLAAKLAPELAEIQAGIRNAEVSGNVDPNKFRELHRKAGLGEATDQQVARASSRIPKPIPPLRPSVRKVDLFTRPKT
jgi:hypothetical protein